MIKKRFRINLKDAHEKSGLTSYAVAKQLDLNQTTVRKYTTQIVETDELLSHVIMMADFYGVNWHDPAIVQVIEEDESEGQMMTPHAVPA